MDEENSIILELVYKILLKGLSAWLPFEYSDKFNTIVANFFIKKAAMTNDV